MVDYKKMVMKDYPMVDGTATETTWDKFKSPIILKEFGAVHSVHISPSSPHDICIAASTRVQVYGANATLKKTLSRFSDTAYSAKFRKDGKLILAGDGSGTIQLFDIGSRAILRTFLGHKAAVRSTVFSTLNSQIASGSDDNSACVWDIPTETALNTFLGHTDYVRSVLVSPITPSLFLTGSYDHTVKLWDGRSQRCSLSLSHGDPVESIVFLNGGGLIGSVGGNKLKIWDLVAGRLVYSGMHHQKTITSLALDGTGSFLLTGSLDHHVKVVSLTDYKVVHSIKYPAPILSMDVSPGNTHLAVGMTGGLFSIRKRPVQAKDAAPKPVASIRGGTYAYFMRGSKTFEEADIKIEAKRKSRLQPYDKFLKKFEYSHALDSVLSGSVNPVVVISMFEELVYRDALSIALAGRDEQSLEPLVYFLIKHIANPRYSLVLLDVANLVLDVYGTMLSSSSVLYDGLKRLLNNVKAEMSVQKRLIPVLGILENVIAAGTR